MDMQKMFGGRSLRPGKLIGDRAFYSMVLAIVLPIIVQNAISNFVNLLDNIMVGRVGTEQMSGVAIANQLMFVFNLCVFGGISGAGIFSAQFYGAGNTEGVRSCFRYKVLLCIALVTTALLLFIGSGKNLISLYLTDRSDPVRVELTLSYGMHYLRVMLWGLAPFALTQVYAGTLRETGETKLPMIAGIIAVFVNLVFNYLLIFDHFGHKGYGVVGAAIATVLSRFVELSIVVLFSHRNTDRFPFIRGIYRTLKVPGALAKQITVKGMPLLVNEGLWSLGMATLSRCYSLRGLDVVAAMNISSTISNLFSVTIFASGSATAIIVGQALGSGDTERAKLLAWRLIAFSVVICLITAVPLFLLAPLFPGIYKTSETVQVLATRFLHIYACCMPLFAYANAAYFILRSGGKTLVTFLFDSGYSWLIAVPVAWCLARFTSMDVVLIYLTVQLCDFIKCAFGHYLIVKGVWVNNMVENI